MKELRQQLEENLKFNIKNASQIIERPGTEGRQMIALNCRAKGKMTTHFIFNNEGKVVKTFQSCGSLMFLKLSEDSWHFECTNTIQLKTEV